jgi:citrate synthase
MDNMIIPSITVVCYLLAETFKLVILKKKAKILAHKKGYEKEFALYELIEKIAPNLVYERKGRIKEVSCNVDFYSGFVYTTPGIAL